MHPIEKLTVDEVKFLKSHNLRNISEVKNRIEQISHVKKNGPLSEDQKYLFTICRKAHLNRSAFDIMMRLLVKRREIGVSSTHNK